MLYPRTFILLLAFSLTACIQGPKTGGETHWQDDTGTSVNDATSGGDTHNSGSDTGTVFDTSASDSSTSADAAQDTGTSTGPSIEVADPQVLVSIDTVMVLSASADAPAMVAIYEGTTTDVVLGTAPLTLLGEDGPELDIAIPLDRDAVDGETLTAALLQDLGVEGTYEAEIDLPFLDTNTQAPVQTRFVVTYPEAALVMSDQTLDNVTTLLSLGTVSTPGRGWLAVHPDNGSDAPDTTALAALSRSSGQLTEDIDSLVTLGPLTDGQVLFARLYQELDDPESFDPSVDLPILDTNSEPLTARFVVTIPDGTPDIRLIVEAEEGAGFHVAVMPGELTAAVLIDTTSAMPNLTLAEGWRYAIDNISATAHPFELIASDDTVLLSQKADGTLEADTDIQWTEDSTSGTAIFTATASFNAAVSGYRCAEHTGVSAGTINP